MTRIKEERNNTYYPGDVAQISSGMEKKINEFLRFSINSNLATIVLLIVGLAIGYIGVKTCVIASAPLIAWNIVGMKLIAKAPKEPISETAQ